MHHNWTSRQNQKETISAFRCKDCGAVSAEYALSDFAECLQELVALHVT
jgi:hypothetical protein